MASRPPGILGTYTNPSYRDRSHGSGQFRPPGVVGGQTLRDVEHRLTVLAHELSVSIGWNQKTSAAYNLLGRQSFTAGVLFGMAENFVKTVVTAVDLVEMLALAEYWESKQNNSLMARVRANMFFAAMPGARIGMMISSHFWPGFDKKAEAAAKERDAIIEAVAYAFKNPKEFLGQLTKSQEARAKEFIALLGKQTLSGNFHAGQLLGELLFDLLMVIDLAVGLAKLAMAVPKLARYTEDFARFARELRAAKQLDRKASDLVEPGQRLTKAEKDAATNSMKGTPERSERRPRPEEEPEFTKSEKGVYGEAQADTYMDEEGFQKLNGDLVKAGDDPLGKGIDGVWKNTNPPPEYVITEAKYGSSQLGTLKDGTKQMSDKWVSDRLDSSVGEEMADDIRDANARGQVEKWLLQVDSDGNVTKTVIPRG